MMASDMIEQIYERGFQLRCEGRYREARQEFARVLESNPKHLEARWQIGLIQGFEGDFDQSIATLSQLAAENPQSVKVLNDLAMTQMMLGLDDDAVFNFKRVLAIEPNHENALKQLSYYE